ncbi:BlaI/MecI/CopY family transcriptional regulator [Lyngbya sp. PCC 8106]|uniref:BlaI/MecI/CopY family transcriptional regulator n=1 Tax=Lyngbya sp. (strain PCC 8106) TaxID=313612 RepID=UPI0000EAB709|nr:BlaI/MecI/CopY family transcriptional regulator [Lyngbya sp. PCC 8106]EAW36575.1 Transcriptional repressor, CopY family protein [Lyngbya sp. PCC 8106]
MTPKPNYRPEKMSLGPLEQEILNIIWDLGCATVKQVHEQILADPDRELSSPSVTTVLNRLRRKGWLSCDRSRRAYMWKPRISRTEAQAMIAYEHLNQFLALGNPDIVAAFASDLDSASLEQLDAIAQRLKALREARNEDK